MRFKMEDRKKRNNDEIKMVKKAALDYQVEEFNKHSNNLVTLFKKESVNMLERYTYLRDELQKRDEILQAATHYTIL